MAADAETHPGFDAQKIRFACLTSVQALAMRPDQVPQRKRPSHSGFAKLMQSVVFTMGFLACLLLAFESHAEKAKPFIFKPSGLKGPYPVVVWLHGYRGYSAEGYFPGEKAEAMQKHAEAIGAVIVGFPGTTDIGDNTQQWSEEPVADHAYIQARLKEIAKTTDVDLHRVALFGFSQGAMVAADLATIYPESYLGAIVMSPGGFAAPKASSIRRPEHAAKVTLKVYPGIAKHTRPPDFMEKFTDWMSSILAKKEIPRNKSE